MSNRPRIPPALRVSPATSGAEAGMQLLGLLREGENQSLTRNHPANGPARPLPQDEDGRSPSFPLIDDGSPPPPIDDTSDGEGDNDDDQSWITVATFANPAQAQIARLRLEADDIPCVLLDENLVATDWLYSTAVGGIKLQVPALQLELARLALQLEPRLAAARAAPDLADRVRRKLEAWVAKLRTLMGRAGD